MLYYKFLVLLSVSLGISAYSPPLDEPHLTFYQNGAEVEARLVDGVYEVALEATEFTVTPNSALFEGDAFDSQLGLTVGREANLRPAVKECQALIEGPLFEAFNKYATSQEPLTTWFVDTPTPGGRFGWHQIRPEDPGISDTGAFTIGSIVEKKGRAELLQAGEEVFLISYDSPPVSQLLRHSCDPPAGADTSEGVVDSRRMNFWRLVFN